jgi:hypothetical protein
MSMAAGILENQAALQCFIQPTPYSYPGGTTYKTIYTFQPQNASANMYGSFYAESVGVGTGNVTPGDEWFLFLSDSLNAAASPYFSCSPVQAFSIPPGNLASITFPYFTYIWNGDQGSGPLTNLYLNIAFVSNAGSTLDYFDSQMLNPQITFQICQTPTVTLAAQPTGAPA